MSQRSAIVVVVDRLGAGYLGPYGNTWLDTPHANRLASESLLVETVLADSAELEHSYRALWQGLHRLEPKLDGERGLAELATDAGYSTVLISDESAVLEHSDAVHFATRVQVQNSLATEEPGAGEGDDLAETTIGRLFVEAIARIVEQQSPALVWVHSRGMSGPWDAPYTLRRQFADEEDPDPPALVEPPRYDVPEGADPDELLGIVQAYAGQVALVDAWLGALLEAVDSSAIADDSLVIVTSPRGYPLGEHHRVGPQSDARKDALYGELLQVPLFVRWPLAASGASSQRNGALMRTQRLGQLGDVAITVADWLSLEIRHQGRMASSLLPLASGGDLAPREIVLASGEHQRIVRTPGWMWRESAAEHEPHHELFAKPDDRWEANEVASRCREVVEKLVSAAEAIELAARDRSLDRLQPLDEELVRPGR